LVIWECRFLNSEFLSADFAHLAAILGDDCITVNVGEIFKLGRGRVISKNYIEQHPGTYPVYSSQSKDKGLMGYINTFDYDGQFVTWTTDGAYAGTVFYRDGKFNCTNVCGTLEPVQNGMDLRFIAYYLNTVTKKFVSYVGNPKLMNNIMATIPLRLPSYELQKKIGEILYQMESRIDILTQLITFREQEQMGFIQRLISWNEYTDDE